MSTELTILLVTAASIGFFHTLFGPDHYLPFIVMAKARGWSLLKTIGITVASGVGHVLSSIVLGFVGIAFGIAVFKLEFIEGIRGSVAAWLLIGFGFIYTVWGIRNVIKGKKHTHCHVHKDGTAHDHEHDHNGDHSHPQLNSRTKAA